MASALLVSCLRSYNKSVCKRQSTFHPQYGSFIRALDLIEAELTSRVLGGDAGCKEPEGDPYLDTLLKAFQVYSGSHPDTVLGMINMAPGAFDLPKTLENQSFMKLLKGGIDHHVLPDSFMSGNEYDNFDLSHLLVRLAIITAKPELRHAELLCSYQCNFPGWEKTSRILRLRLPTDHSFDVPLKGSRWEG